MPARKRTKLQRDEQLGLITKMAIRGVPQSQIAKKFGLTQQQVSHDLKEVRARLLPLQTDHVLQARAERMTELALIKQEYWEQWERSKMDKEVQTQEKIT